MKVPPINFAAPRRALLSPRMWAALAVAVSVFAIDAWWSARSHGEQARHSLEAYALAASEAASGASLAASQPHGEPATALPGRPPLDAAGVLRAVEAVRLPGVRLLSLLIDRDQGVARAEVELADLGQVGPCLALLNREAAEGRWEAVGVQAADGQRPSVLTVEWRMP